MDPSSLYILYAVLAIGAIGLYGLMPRAVRPSPVGAGFLAMASCAGLIVLGARGLGWGGSREFYFYVFGSLSLIGAVRVVTHTRPVYSALYFVLVVLSVAGVLVITDAPFLAAALVIIYAGAILVTYVFVIMLAQQSGSTPYDATAREPLLAVALGFALVACIGSLLVDVNGLEEDAAAPGGASTPAALAAHAAALASAAPMDAAAPTDATAPRYERPDAVRELGATLLTRYAVAVEVAGVLLLVAMVGAIWVARRQIPADDVPAIRKDERPVGEVGREVPPF